MSPDKLPPAVIEAALDAASDLIVLHDLEGTILFANDAARGFFGPDPDGIVGRRFDGLLAPEFLCQWEELKPRIAAQEALRFEVRGSRSDGAPTFFDVRSKVLRIEGRRLVLSVARDVTGPKALERELGARVADLEEFYRIAVDRELAMIGLKKEIRALTGRPVENGSRAPEGSPE